MHAKRARKNSKSEPVEDHPDFGQEHFCACGTVLLEGRCYRCSMKSKIGQCSRNWGHAVPCNGLACEWWLQSHPAATYEHHDPQEDIAYCLDLEGPISSTPDDAGANEFQELTGAPILLNTSFNNNAEPVVD